MTPEKKKNRRLRNLVILSLLLLLVGGTYAFTAFNQRAINDRENDVQVNVGGRVHDYYNRDTENKDVFVENYGERPIMARIRLSEFLEYRQGTDGPFTQLVDGDREEPDTWTPYIPNATNIGTRTGEGAAFNRYSNLRFGRAGEAPWYLPTFNHNNLDLSTAAAGDARDLDAESGSPDVTHPGDGTDGFWTEGVTYTNGQGPTNTIWHGAEADVERTTMPNLQQGRAPLTIEQWANLQPYQQIGDFWVIDYTTGWAYWASLLDPGEATSYLLDAAEMTSAIEDTVFNGTYYYGIHVDSQLISPDHSDDFLEGGDSRLADFLTGVQNNAMDGVPSNPHAFRDSPPSAFNFASMLPGRVFTMDGVQYRYLEDMGNGNHMIIRNESIRNTSFNDQPQVLSDFYNELTPAVQEIVQPVSIPTEVPSISAGDAAPWTGGPLWLPEEWNDSRFDAVRADRTVRNTGGTPQAFALSLADVVHLSTDEGPFPNHAARVGARNSWWALRTPGAFGLTWKLACCAHAGELFGTDTVDFVSVNGGVRPALIVNQAP